MDKLSKPLGKVTFISKDVHFKGRTFTAEIMVKMEPMEFESEPYLDIKCEEGIDIKTEQPTTPFHPTVVRTIDEVLDVRYIKSEIPLSRYECVESGNQIVANSTEKKFTCDECGTKFVRKNDLVSHLRIHTGL